MLRRAGTVVIAGAACACASPRLDAFEATMAAQDSATAGLRAWCAAQGIAAPADIRARVDRAPPGEPAPSQVRTALALAPGETLSFRHVRLVCGDTVLSDARNWYVPARLTPQMNAALAGTDRPFGEVIAATGFVRERLAAQRGRGPGCPAGTVLTHRAVLRDAAGQPLAFVVECYTRAVLG